MAGIRFLCDEMLKGLGRWLRAAGYDTEIATGGTGDAELVARARAEGRWFVSRDRKIAEHKAAADVLVLLEAGTLDTCAIELGHRLGLDWLHGAFSRCIDCNRPLEDLPRALRHRLPAERAGEKARWCPDCGRVYWDGGHVRRMRRRLARWHTEVSRERG